MKALSFNFVEPTVVRLYDSSGSIVDNILLEDFINEIKKGCLLSHTNFFLTEKLRLFIRKILNVKDESISIDRRVLGDLLIEAINYFVKLNFKRFRVYSYNPYLMKRYPLNDLTETVLKLPISKNFSFRYFLNGAEMREIEFAFNKKEIQSLKKIVEIINESYGIGYLKVTDIIF